MKIKVCGLRESEDLLSLGNSGIDYMGFVFYEASPRYARYKLDTEVLKLVPKPVKKVGVFVDADAQEIIDTAEQFNLDVVQLHGQESPETCATLRARVRVIKAFNVDEEADLNALASPYEPHCDFFLFDASGIYPGGNGLRFNWELLSRYTLDTPFFLSGGIGPEHTAELMRIHHPQLHACDVNSRFELQPGKKNTSQIRFFVNALKSSAYGLPGY